MYSSNIFRTTFRRSVTNADRYSYELNWELCIRYASKTKQHCNTHLTLHATTQRTTLVVSYPFDFFHSGTLPIALLPSYSTKKTLRKKYNDKPVREDGIGSVIFGTLRWSWIYSITQKNNSSFFSTTVIYLICMYRGEYGPRDIHMHRAAIWSSIMVPTPRCFRTCDEAFPISEWNGSSRALI